MRRVCIKCGQDIEDNMIEEIFITSINKWAEMHKECAEKNKRELPLK